jgi:hypothetical protein
VLVVVHYARHGLAAVAGVLVAAALFELRSRYAATLGSADESRIGYAVFEALYHLWVHLAVVFPAIGVLAWLGVLVGRRLVEAPASLCSHAVRRPMATLRSRSQFVSVLALIVTMSFGMVAAGSTFAVAAQLATMERAYA